MTTATATPLQSYYAIVGTNGRGFIEVLVRRFGPGRYEYEPTGIVYATAHEAQSALAKRNA